MVEARTLRRSALVDPSGSKTPAMPHTSVSQLFESPREGFRPLTSEEAEGHPSPSLAPRDRTGLRDRRQALDTGDPRRNSARWNVGIISCLLQFALGPTVVGILAELAPGAVPETMKDRAPLIAPARLLQMPDGVGQVPQEP